MLQVIREKAQGAIAWTIVVLIGLAFTLVGVNGFRSDRENIAARINGYKVTTYEVENEYNQQIRYFSNQEGFDITKINPQKFKREITKVLAENHAVLAGVKKQGFHISDQQVMIQVQNNPMFQEDGNFSLTRYQQFLNQLSLSEPEFTRRTKQNLMLQQMQTGLTSSSFLLDGEINHAMKLINQTRDFGYAMVPYAKYEQDVVVTEEDIQALYDKEKSNFMAPEQVKVAYLEMTIDSLLPQVEVTPEGVATFYQQNMHLYQEPELLQVSHIFVKARKDSDAEKSGEARDKIDDIYAKLKLGANFAEVAKTDSDDKFSARNGGDLGWINHNDPYPEEVFALENIQDISEVVQTDFGFHVFQLVDRKAAKQKAYEDIASVVEARYRREQAEHSFTEKAEELANLAFEHPDSLHVVASKLGLELKETGYFSNKGGEGIATVDGVVEAAFSDEVLLQEQNSDLVKLSDERYLVLRVVDQKPAHQQELTEVRDNIVAFLTRGKAQEEAKAVSHALVEALKEGNTPHKVSQSKNLTWETMRNIERGNSDVDNALIRHVFSMKKPPAGNPFTLKAVQLPTGDYAVVALSAVKEGVIDETDDADAQQMFRQQIANMKGQVEFELYKGALISQAKIEYIQPTEQ